MGKFLHNIYPVIKKGEDMDINAAEILNQATITGTKIVESVANANLKKEERN